MKSYLLMSALVSLGIVALHGTRSLEESMIDATSHADLIELKALMMKFERDCMSPAAKKGVLEVLQATCNDLQNASLNSSLVFSKRDLFSALLGSFIGVWGLSHLIGGLYDTEDFSKAPEQPFILAQTMRSSLFAVIGGYLLLQGLLKVNQRRTYKISCKIDDYLAHAAWKVDFPSKEQYVS